MKKVDIKATLMRTAGVSGGAIGAGMLNKISVIGSQTATIRGIIKIGLGGVVLPMLAGKSKKAAIADAIGDGAIAIGAAELYNGLVAKGDATKAIAISGFPTLGAPPVRMRLDEGYLGKSRVKGPGLPTLGDVPNSMNNIIDYSKM